MLSQISCASSEGLSPRVIDKNISCKQASPPSQRRFLAKIDLLPITLSKFLIKSSETSPSFPADEHAKSNACRDFYVSIRTYRSKSRIHVCCNNRIVRTPICSRCRVICDRSVVRKRRDCRNFSGRRGAAVQPIDPISINFSVRVE